MVQGSNPCGRTAENAGVAELVYAPALGADGATHGGSSPLPSTKKQNRLIAGFVFLLYTKYRLHKQKERHVPEKSHIGITGFGSNQEYLDVLGKKNSAWKSSIQAGVLVSSKTLAGLRQEQTKRFPSMEVLPTIFGDIPGVLNLIHFNTNQREQLVDDLLKAHELAGPYCHGFQLNIAWPSIQAIEEYRKVHPTAKITLQCGTKALDELENLEQDLPRRVLEYGDLINYVMIDQSGGKGLVYDHSFMFRAFSSLEAATQVGLILAGGLSYKNLYRLHPLWKRFKEFSIDVESGVRNKQDDFDVHVARAFLHIADAVFEQRALTKSR